MGTKRKKLKKRKPHFTDAPGVHPDSVAGRMRARNEKTQAMLDELD